MQLWYNEAVASKTHENSEQLIGDNTASAVEESKHSGKNNSQTATNS